MEKELIIYGLRPVIEAINAGKEVEKVLIQTGLRSELFHDLRVLLAQNSIPYQFVPVEKLNRITQKNHQGIIAYISSVTYGDIENIIPFLFDQGKSPLILILDRITDVRNFGAIARTAVCAGCDAIIIPYYNSVRVSSDAIKSSAGALHLVPVCRSSSLIKTVEFLKSCGLQIVACSEKTQQPYYKTDMVVPTAIIMGSEEDGITDILLKSADQKVKIPMAGEIASLNVSVACGIILFEACKQRNVL
ncbi:MAG TPA: 23S rRNA (guanosine(2251)-2'-O)-methyltransferase RlmB [Bacteroidales bacterium]|mgnify:CR=1 FL=1|nr:23S rRNA (guanosine(2251)-2'-O)-methyltransferase RlmB [Bacteroidales bacterium]HQI71360.1 23S rRNA (guanosine(2251)-2'-O)-methyltransferase RlmB [Bacteroidales bacterium]